MNCTQLVYNSSADLIAFCYKGCDYKVNDCFCYCLDDKIFYNIDSNNYINVVMTCLFVAFIIFGGISVMGTCQQKQRQLTHISNNNENRTQPENDSSLQHSTINVYEIYNQLPKYDDVIRGSKVSLLQENAKENNNITKENSENK